MRVQTLIENSRQNQIAELQPDTIVRIFHGTDLDQAISFVEEGIDGRKRVSRLFPHFIGQQKQMVNRGLFVTIDLKSALDFGHAIIKFAATGKDL